MKKKILALSLLTAIALTSCGSNATEPSVQATESTTSVETTSTTVPEEVVESTTSQEEIESVASEMASEAMSEITDTVKDAANIESDKNLLSIEVTLPASVDDITDAEIEELKKEDGYISITRNEDNSITYVMTKDKQKELLEKLESRFADFANTIPGSENYPNVTKLEVNKDFSKFTITTTATTKDEITLPETILAASFYSFGGAYRGYACEADTSVIVDYVCDSTGQVIASGNSANVE